MGFGGGDTCHGEGEECKDLEQHIVRDGVNFCKSGGRLGAGKFWHSQHEDARLYTPRPKGRQITRKAAASKYPPPTGLINSTGSEGVAHY